MKFLVSRTSQYGEGKPCDGSVYEEYDRPDLRTFQTPEEHDC